MFKKGSGDWTQYRKLERCTEVDFHRSDDQGRREVPYWAAMGDVYAEALDALQSAQAAGTKYILFTHGSSTSRPGRTTARSQVRKLMRSGDATPYIIRAECIQHESVFVVAIRPKHPPDTEPD